MDEAKDKRQDVEESHSPQAEDQSEQSSLVAPKNSSIREQGDLSSSPVAHDEEQVARIRAFVFELLAKMGFEVEVEVVSERRFLRVFLSGEDADSLVVGSGAAAQANVLDAIQLILGRVFLSGNSDKTIIVDVNGFREARSGLLEQASDQMADRCVESGKSFTIYGMNSFDRRAVHVRLRHRNDVRTDSMGENTRRVLIIESLAKGGLEAEPGGNEPLDKDTP